MGSSRLAAPFTVASTEAAKSCPSNKLRRTSPDTGLSPLKSDTDTRSAYPDRSLLGITAIKLSAGSPGTTSTLGVGCGVGLIGLIVAGGVVAVAPGVGGWVGPAVGGGVAPIVGGWVGPPVGPAVGGPVGSAVDGPPSQPARATKATTAANNIANVKSLVMVRLLLFRHSGPRAGI